MKKVNRCQNHHRFFLTLEKELSTARKLLSDMRKLNYHNESESVEQQPEQQQQQSQPPQRKPRPESQIIVEPQQSQPPVAAPRKPPIAPKPVQN